MYRRFFKFALMVSIGLAGLPAGAEAGTQTIAITMTDYAMQLSSDSIHAGRVRFIVKNDSSDLTHEFFIAKTELSLSKLPLESDGKIDEDSSMLHKIVAAEDINPGGSKIMSVTLGPGHYVYFCNINGHHMLGMHGEFTVKPRAVDI
jgi:uncharacterized cupredoxin-like copper-binding protein